MINTGPGHDFGSDAVVSRQSQSSVEARPAPAVMTERSTTGGSRHSGGGRWRKILVSGFSRHHLMPRGDTISAMRSWRPVASLFSCEIVDLRKRWRPVVEGYGYGYGFYSNHETCFIAALVSRIRCACAPGVSQRDFRN